MSASADIEQLRDLQDDVPEDYVPPQRPLRIYIAGPMGGLPEYNYPAFHAAAQKVRAAGFEVINPAEADLFFGPPGNVPRESYLRLAMTNVGMCDAIYLLPGWQESGGALLELHLAQELGLNVVIDINVEAGVLYLAHIPFHFRLVQQGTGEVMQRGQKASVYHQVARYLEGLAARFLSWFIR